MKKILMILLAVVLVLSACACGQNKSGTESSAAGSRTESQSEAGVKGTEHKYGRFSVLIPEGWSAVDLGDYQADYNAVIVKGAAEDFMTASQVSIIYNLPSELVVSSRGFYDDTKDEGEFDLGGRHWEAWSAAYEEMSFITAESSGEDGTVTVALQMLSADAEKLSLDDPDVQAIIESIVVVPTVEVEWITITDGVVTAKLQEVEGYQWDGNGEMVMNDVEADTELNGNVLTVTPHTGTGAFVEEMGLYNEDGSFSMGSAKISIRITDGKADAVYAGEMKIFDEPEAIEIDDFDFEDNVDYDYLTEVFSGAWADDKNDLTLFIQRSEEEEHACQITIQSAEHQMSGVGVIQITEALMYEEMSIDGETVQTNGYFALDGDMLIWGHDDEVGVFEYVTIFTKLE